VLSHYEYTSLMLRSLWTIAWTLCGVRHTKVHKGIMSWPTWWGD